LISLRIIVLFLFILLKVILGEVLIDVIATLLLILIFSLS
jgi:hypothetical protein